MLQENQDPRRIHRFLEMLLEDPLDDQRGSFSDSRLAAFYDSSFAVVHNTHCVFARAPVARTSCSDTLSHSSSQVFFVSFKLLVFKVLHVTCVCVSVPFSRLYFIQGALFQQEWRVPDLLHRLMGVLERHLNHPYKNVRDRLGRLVC